MSTSTTTSTKRRTTSSTPDERAEKLAELHEQITDGVAALVDSDAWRAMLDAAATFHTYSLGNVMLIARQAPHTTRVAGFRTWKSLGRQVRKGERGLAILAPCTYRPKATTASGSEQDNGEQGKGERGGEAAPAGGRQVRGFRVVHVFDVAQTDGEPLPDVAPALLTGQAPAGLWDTLAAQVAGHGYTLQRGDCAGANGYTDPASRTVRVRADVDDAQAVKTLAHELGHLECGHLQQPAGPAVATAAGAAGATAAGTAGRRGRGEVEAESVAYIVAAAHGLDAGGYTFAYVAGWAGGDLTTVRSAAETVTTAARRILTSCTSPVGPSSAAEPAAATAGGLPGAA